MKKDIQSNEPNNSEIKNSGFKNPEIKNSHEKYNTKHANLYEETQFLMKKYKIHANKNLGQNFLIDENVINTAIEKSQITKEDLVIEIGPGLGTLTKYLLEKAGKVIAVELDPKMVEVLKNRFFLYNNFEILNNDILKVDLNEIINENLQNGELKRAKIVANLPYYITTPIIMGLLEKKINIESITVMIQKEVADRLTEIPGGKNTGAITYTVYYYGEAEEILEVPKESFIPQPSVTSEVIKINIRKNPAVEAKNSEEEKFLFKIIKTAFLQRRKTLINSLSNNGIVSKETIEKALKQMGLDPKIRSEKLTLEEFFELSKLISSSF